MYLPIYTLFYLLVDFNFNNGENFLLENLLHNCLPFILSCVSFAIHYASCNLLQPTRMRLGETHSLLLKLPIIYMYWYLVPNK